jgi:aryl-phospho-beta-D-glucosidase BglC (GH1 family)
MKQFLQTQKTHIIKGSKAITLKGVNLGGWLMMEGYILSSPNYPEHQFKNKFKKALGHQTLKEFEKSFRNCFIQESDFEKIKQMGFNCIRLPFNYRLVEKSAGKYDLEGVKILDQAVSWAKKYQIYAILDLHAAQGSQNHDWHSDSAGQAELWTNTRNQKRTLDLWEFLADRYKNEENIAGYDLLNEPVVNDARNLNEF